MQLLKQVGFRILILGGVVVFALGWIFIPAGGDDTAPRGDIERA